MRERERREKLDSKQLLRSREKKLFVIVLDFAPFLSLSSNPFSLTVGARDERQQRKARAALVHSDWNINLSRVVLNRFFLKR